MTLKILESKYSSKKCVYGEELFGQKAQMNNRRISEEKHSIKTFSSVLFRQNVRANL